MLINEVQSDQDALQLAGISQFLLRRAQETNAKKVISAEAFLKIAKDNGININLDLLRTLSQRAPLNNVIGNIEGDGPQAQIVFKGEQSTDDSAAMSVDQARSVVDANAKQAMKRRI